MTWRVETTRKGPNNPSGVVWALVGKFFVPEVSGGRYNPDMLVCTVTKLTVLIIHTCTDVT